MHPTIAVSNIVRDIKASSSKWISENKLIKGQFKWQEGYGAFTYSKSQIDSVVRYILNQPEHHRKKSFKDEYLDTLNNAGIKYEERYLFEWYN